MINDAAADFEVISKKRSSGKIPLSFPDFEVISKKKKEKVLVDQQANFARNWLIAVFWFLVYFK